jgi:uncharacterized protein
MINRNLYIEKIRPYINQKLIKVLTGQRRVGKTYVMQLLLEEITKQYPKANIIYIDKEKYEFDYIRNHVQLMEYIDMHKKAEMNYVFIDEIQDIDGFERVLRSLNNENNFDLYCTGSNAKMFSGELATYLSGRQLNFQISSLNFTEFCVFHKIQPNYESLNKYMKFGGLPYLMHLPDDDKIRFEYLDNINSTILFRDVINRHQIRDPRFLTDLLKFLADNIGSLFSANKISVYLKNQQIEKNVAKILDYLSHIENAYYINRVLRTDIQGKKHFEVGEKYYFEDIGLRNSIIGYKPQDVGKIMENLVFLHLRSSGFSITIGSDNNREIDFIASKDGEKIYFQVTYLLADDKVVEREFGNLLKIDDNYPKYVISYDTFSAPNTYKGIKHLTLLEFLSDFK